MPAIADTPTQAQAARFLTQATFGPRQADINQVVSGGYQAWLNTQFAAPASGQLNALIATGDQFSRDNRLKVWWNTTVNGPDQLRQRVAFALSEMLVVSDQSAALDTNANAVAYYNDILARDAFGNYRTLLQDVTLSPAMGLYLNMLGNPAPDPANNVHTDENYARELMQLFTIGLVQLNADGTVKTGVGGVGLPTYTQSDVTNLARALTGWSWEGSDFFNGPPANLTQMVAFDAYHDTNAKTIVGGVQISAGTTAAQDLKTALDTLFNHPNVGPFVSRQLIQRLVTSNPSPAYVGRVAAVFNNNGSGVRGDMKAVVQAILLDSEARNDPTGSFGKLREPILQVTHFWRVFNAHAQNGQYGLTYPEGVIGQAPLGSPTVFNFFRPSYAPVGAVKSAGLVAPEMQIVNAASVALVANFFASSIYGMDKDLAQSPQPGDLLLDLTAFKPSAVSNPSAMLDQLNLLLLNGQMTASTRQALLTYINTVDPSDGGSARVQEAAYLILTSPQYQMQK
ncbi:MAG: DUF1800 domain-containing protein [Burkholderiales bacterium]|nr:DUF1800 domain-containing protein [Burkholderiales bacterium]